MALINEQRSLIFPIQWMYCYLVQEKCKKKKKRKKEKKLKEFKRAFWPYKLNNSFYSYMVLRVLRSLYKAPKPFVQCVDTPLACVPVQNIKHKHKNTVELLYNHFCNISYFPPKRLHYHRDVITSKRNSFHH